MDLRKSGKTSASGAVTVETCSYTGASPDDIVKDYMQSYINYYGTKPYTAQLQEAVIEYLTTHGMEDAAVNHFRKSFHEDLSLFRS